MPPTFLEMDILLSFMIIIKFVFNSAALFNASYAIPPVRAPSPITETTWCFCPRISLACTYPSPAEIELELCPASYASQGLSLLLGKPLNPPSCRRFLNSSFLPVRILCVYAWCPTSQISLSSGKSSTLWRARVSSTTPRFEARCPPVWLTDRIKKSLISAARGSKSSNGILWISLGFLIFSRIICILPLFSAVY